MVRLRLGAPRLPSQLVYFSQQSHDIDVLAADHGRASWTLACDSAALLHALVMLATHEGACLCADTGERACVQIGAARGSVLVCRSGLHPRHVQKSMPNTKAPGTG